MTTEQRRNYSREQYYRNRDEAKRLSGVLGMKINRQQLHDYRLRKRAENRRLEGAKYWMFLLGKEFAGKSLAELALKELNSIRDVFKQEHLTAEQAIKGDISVETLRAGARGYVLTVSARHNDKAGERGSKHNPGFRILEELGV
jgi:hypothetical protein